MSFTYIPKTYLLKFGPGSNLEGLEVEATSVPVGGFIKVMALASSVGDKDDENAAVSMAELFDTFGKSIVSWNLTDLQGNAVPPTADSLNSMPVEFGMQLIEEWMRAIGGVKPDLGKDSDSGVTYPEVPMPMAAA